MHLSEVCDNVVVLHYMLVDTPCDDVLLTRCNLLALKGRCNLLRAAQAAVGTG